MTFLYKTLFVSRGGMSKRDIAVWSLLLVSN